MQEMGNYDVNPYLTDTARHILDIAVSAYPGLSPADNETLIPLKLIQHVLTHTYGLKKYIPTIIAPQYFSLEKNNSFVYYSMQYPTTRSFPPKTKNTVSTLMNMEDLKRIIDKFKAYISKEGSMWNGSILQNSVNNIKISYIHNSSNHGITLPSKITEMDNRFNFAYDHCFSENATPAHTANFLRGCIMLSK